MKKFTVAPIIRTYLATGLSEKELNFAKENNINIEFKAFSVGNDTGQVAIFPIDEFGVVKAKENANKLCSLLNSNIQKTKSEFLTAEPLFSLRDQFAMSAMNGFLSNSLMTGDYSGTLPEWLSKRAYIIADEMLKTRQLEKF